MPHRRRGEELRDSGGKVREPLRKEAECHVRMHQIRPKTHGSTESVDSFITALYKLSGHCGFIELRDRMIIQRIILDIRDTGLSQKLQLDPELILNKCITRVRQTEAVKKQQEILRSQGAAE